MNTQTIKRFVTPYQVTIIVVVMLIAVLQAFAFNTARAQNHATVDIVITAGVVDNFAQPTDPASPSSNLLGSRSWSLKNFDSLLNDRVVAHTFTNLPKNIYAATLEVHLKPGANSLSHNDGINLTFVEDDQVMPPLGSERWSRRIGTMPSTGGHDGVPGVLPYDWHSTAASPNGDTIMLDLSNLPLAPGQPASANNLILALNQHGFLDFWIQDDTTVDYITLTLTVNGAVVLCHIPPGGNPPNAHTITVNASAVATHLSHGDTLGACENNEEESRGNAGKKGHGK